MLSFAPLQITVLRGRLGKVAKASGHATVYRVMRRMRICDGLCNNICPKLHPIQARIPLTLYLDTSKPTPVPTLQDSFQVGRLAQKQDLILLLLRLAHSVQTTTTTIAAVSKKHKCAKITQLLVAARLAKATFPGRKAINTPPKNGNSNAKLCQLLLWLNTD